MTLLTTVSVGYVGSTIAADSLTITSWNVANLHHVPGYAYRGEIGTWRTIADLSIIKKVIKSQDPDVILLQEASGELAVRDVLGKGYTILGTKEYDDRRDHAYLLKRIVYPFTAVRTNLGSNIIFRSSIGLVAEANPSETRDIQYFRIKVTDKIVGLIHIHGKSSCPDTVKVDSDNSSCQLIYAQFLKVSEILKMADADDVVLVIGDFNRELLNPKLRVWREHYAPWAKAIIAPPSCILRPSLQPIDFAIVAKIPADSTVILIEENENVLSILKHPDRISDHCPLTIRISFK